MEEKYKILIVDDEQSILDMLKLQLEFEGYSVYTAGNAAEALDKLSYSPDIVLLDINMDGMNGLDLCVSIRDFISCPIIFLTARVSEQDKINGLMAGGDDYITKPFSVNELLARISAHLRREQRSHNKTKSKFSEDLIIDYSDRSLYIKGHKIELSNKNLKLYNSCLLMQVRFLTEKKFMKIFGALTAMETALLSKSIYEKYV